MQKFLDFVAFNREIFALDILEQLRELQPDSGRRSTPIRWNNASGKSVSSAVYVYSFLVGTPERSQFSGRVGHKSTMACMFCKQPEFTKDTAHSGLSMNLLIIVQTQN